MSEYILVPVLAGLGGMLGWGISDLLAKKTIDEIGDIRTLVVAHFFGTALMAAALAYQFSVAPEALAFPTNLGSWAGAALFGALQAAVYLLVYIGFGKGQIAVLNPIFSAYSGVVALIALVFLGEQATPLILAGLFAIFLGIMGMNIDREALRDRRIRLTNVPGFIQIAGATVLASIWTLGWNSFVSGHDWLAYGASMYVFMTVALVLYAMATRLSLRVQTPWAWKYLLFIGLFESGAYLAISWGYAATSATAIVAVLSGAFSLPTIIGARLWLKERTTSLQLWGSIIIVLGIICIALA